MFNGQLIPALYNWQEFKGPSRPSTSLGFVQKVGILRFLDYSPNPDHKEIFTEYPIPDRKEISLRLNITITTSDFGLHLEEADIPRLCNA